MDKAELEEVLGEGHPVLGPIQAHLDAVAHEDETPALAIAACVARIEEAAPALRAALRRAADGETLEPGEDGLLFRGLHILGGARDRQSLPLLLRLLRLPVEVVDELIGDTVTESLPRIVIGLFDDDHETALFEAMDDRAIDPFARGSLIAAAGFLTWEGRIPADRMRAWLHRFHDERLADDLDYAWIAWLDAIAKLGWRDLAPLVAQAMREGRVGDDVIDFSGFEIDLAEAEAAPGDAVRFERANLGYIEDVLDALAWCDWEGRAFANIDDIDDDATWDYDAPEPQAPVINPWRGVGRNDPCPCGSGKKAKKCCLAQG
jgi:hypothetical protein